MAFREVGIELYFEGKDENEVGRILNCIGEFTLPKDKIVIKVDPSYYRPTEVDLLVGDATKAKEKLGWRPKYDLIALVKEMIISDLNREMKW